MKLHHQVRKRRIGIGVAFAGAHAFQVVPAERGNEIGGHLHERLDPRRGVDVSLLEGLLGFVEDLHQRAFQNRQFRNGGGRERGVVLFHRGRVCGNVHGMVAQPLELGRDFVILVQNRDVVFDLQMRQKLHHVPADPVGQAVDLVLLRKDLLVNGGIIFIQQMEGLFNVRPRGGEDREQRFIAALQRKGGGVEEDRVQRVGHRLVLAFLCRLVLHDLPAQLFKNGHQRKQRERTPQVEYRVGICNDTGIDRAVPQLVQKSELVHDRHDKQNESGFAEVEQDVHDADTARFRLGSDGDDDGGGHAVAEIDADDDRINGLERQQSGRGERLQNTDGGRGALQCERNARAGQIAQKRIVSETGKQGFDDAGL